LMLRKRSLLGSLQANLVFQHKPNFIKSLVLVLECDIAEVVT